MTTLGLLHVHLHVFHHVKGPPFDYVGIGLASFASWVGLPGPGEAVLLAAGVFAARHKLDISPVVLVAFVGATLGGIAGWLIGRQAGRPVLMAPGPLHSIRLDAIEQGEAAFKRMEAVAIFLTPSWVAGINPAGPVIYNVVNAASALAWALAIAVGGYYIGAPIVEAVDDLGTAGLIAAVVLAVGAVVVAVIRRQRGAVRRQARRESPH
jgi:membrane protein DedA with SNARE-associated domain